MTDNTTKTNGPTIRTETMAQLLLSQGHWQQARQVYQEIYGQEPEKYAHMREILAEIDREYTAKQPDVPDQTTIIKTQIDYLNTFLKQIKEEL
ncbi:MAG: hypothetical protein J7J70_07215 [Deltaproteobacteria bacterium]|nr:hypothetical protein [Candidatus Tharpellaceae bacterium]